MVRLFAYADDSNLYELESVLVGAFREFTGSWGVAGTRLRNTKAPLMPDQEIPDWNIGFSVEASEISRQHIEQLLNFLVQLSREVNLAFVVGTWQHRGSGRDLCFIERQIPDGAVGTILEGVNAP